jgi:phage/plasmid-like protein (TIGR03299 family)
MAHLLENSNDMAYLGETPWHRLGVQIEAPMSVNEALKFGALDFEVSKVPMFLGNGDKVEDNYAIVRSDNGRQLGVVGEKYTPLQNKEAFSFFDPFVTRKEALFHTVGVIRGGRRIWLLAKLPGEIVVKGDDITGKYLLLSNSHDGTSGVQIKFTPIRVVCNNTLQAALKGTGTTYKIRHTKNVHAAVQEASKAMGIANQYYTELQEAFQTMQRREVTFTQAASYIREVFEAESASAAKGSTRAENILEEVYSLLEAGKGVDLPGVRGTMWGAYNAVTEYVDHHKGYRSDDSALENIAFGLVGGNLKQRAFDLALKA